MSLTDGDKQDIRQIFNEGITELVLPRFDKVESDIEILKEDVATLKEDVATLKEDVHSLQDTTNRIEMLQRSELDRVDDHEVRIGKLEQAHAK